MFAANPRDGFVPLHSASVRSPPSASTGGDNASSNNNNGTATTTTTTTTAKKTTAKMSSRTCEASAEMAEMLMSKVDERRNRVVRITVDNPRRQAQSRGALDTVIGRAGHVCFIDSPQVSWLISLALLPFMEEGRR